MKNIYTIIIILFFLSKISYTQNQIWTVDGKKLTFSKCKFDDEKENLFYVNKKGKIKFIEKEFVFSIEKTLNFKINEEIIYSPVDTNQGQYTVNQMREYVNGAHLAKNFYKTPLLYNIGGVIVGSGSVVFLSPVYLALIPSTSYAPIISSFKISEKKIKEEFPEKSKSSSFINGYKDKAKQKKVKQTFICSIAGVVLGITIMSFIN